MICGLISFVLNNVTGSLAGIQSFSCDWTYIGIMFNSIKIHATCKCSGLLVCLQFLCTTCITQTLNKNGLNSYWWHYFIMLVNHQGWLLVVILFNVAAQSAVIQLAIVNVQLSPN